MAKDIGKSSFQALLKRLSGNTLSLAGMTIIVLSVIIAAAGYIILPDKTPWCNQQILQIAAKKPGFSTKVLYVRKNEEIERQGFFRTIIFGRKASFDIYPMLDYSIADLKIIIREYTDFPDEDFFYREFDLADVLFPVRRDSGLCLNGDKSGFFLINGTYMEYDVAELRKIIENKSIGKKKYILGTDRFGRDLLSRVLLGTRVSLTVGFIAVAISLLIGVSLGALAGYFGGFIDSLIMWFVNVIWSVPTLLMVIALTIVIGKGYWQVFLAVGLTMWVEVARVVRGQVMSIKEKEFVEAARALGFSNFRILFRHILPNVLSPVIIISAANFASAILIEAGLSFLGIGVQPPVPSWGGMIKDHYGYIIVDKAYLAFIPGVAIMLLVLAFTMTGNGLRDAMDVRRE